MHWQAISLERARCLIGEGIRCRLSGAGLRISAVSECLRAVAYLCSYPDSMREAWEPVASVRLTYLVRHRLASLWPEIIDGSECGTAGVINILEQLADLGDMVRLEGGRWLPAPPHAIEISERKAIFLGGGPIELLPNTLSATVVGRVRLVEKAACEGWAEVWEANEWIGAPTEGLEVWSERLLSRAYKQLVDAPDSMEGVSIYIRGKWVRLEDFPKKNTGLHLCKLHFSEVAGQYFIGEVGRGRLRRISEINTSEARRLRFHLDAQAGCSVKVIAVASQGMLMLRLKRRLPDREARVLLLGWQIPTPYGEHPGVTHHMFCMEMLPVLREVFKGLRVILDERF